MYSGQGDARQEIRLCAAVSGILAFGFRFSGGFSFGLRTHDIDRAGVYAVLDVARIEVLDHLDAGPAVVGDLIDVRAFHQTHGNISVAQAVSRAALSVAVEFQLFFFKYLVEQVAPELGKHLHRRKQPFDFAVRLSFVFQLRNAALPDLFERIDRIRHALAVADAGLAAHVDDENVFLRGIIVLGFRVPEFEIPRFVRTQAGIRHEQYEGVKVFVFVLPAASGAIVDAFARCLLEGFVFVVIEPGAASAFALRHVRCRKAGDERYPAHTLGMFEHLPDDDDFGKHRAARRRPARRYDVAFRVFFGGPLDMLLGAFDAIALDQTAIDLRKGLLPK